MQKSSKISANGIQQYIKTVIHHNQVRLIPWKQGWFKICNPINMVHHINQRRDNTMISFVDAGKKFFEKIQHPFMIKILIKVGKEEAYIVHSLRPVLLVVTPWTAAHQAS